MARHSSRLLRLVRWQYMFPTFALALGACNAHDLQVPKPNPQQQTDFSILVAPERAVDIMFMIDNSPSMDPKQRALAKNFPNMIEALQKLEGGLPDVHIGVISSDMGAGTGEAGQNCAYVLGNQGLLWGNDPDVAGPDPNNGYNKFATVKTIDNGCGMNSGARWISDIQVPGTTNRDKNYTGNLTEVFSCLAKGVGVNGCGFEHQLQSLRVALNPIEQYNKQNRGFLRRNAFLAVVLITDEDDCSADPNKDTNDGMFFPRILSETASLRCATRGHVCNGADIPGYDDPSKGYSGSGFETDFANCAAKDVERQPDKKPDPTYHDLPLIRVQEMIGSVNNSKDRPDDQILASGIIGWPQDGKLDGVKYRIDKDSSAAKDEQKKLWDYMPICRVESEKSADGEMYKVYGGFRLKKFLDAYKKTNETNVFSLCSMDNFAAAMSQIGTAIVQRLKPGCVQYPLIDTDASDDIVQPECQVVDKIVCDSTKDQGCLSTGYKEQPLKECRDGNGKPLDPSTAKQNAESAVADDDAHRPCWYLVYDADKDSGCPNAFRNQRITALRKKGFTAPPGTLLDMQCLTCAASPVDATTSACPALGTM